MHEILNEYLTILSLEKNLSDNSVFSYRNDISKLLEFLISYQITDIDEIRLKNLHDYFALQKELGMSTATVSRYLSSIKGFLGYCKEYEYIRQDPSEKISAPEITRKIPVVLSINEVNKILNCPDISNELGLRDKAILELFYSSGLRVSELINITQNDLFFQDKIIRVLGKGNQQRIIPIGSSDIN